MAPTCWRLPRASALVLVALAAPSCVSLDVSQGEGAALTGGTATTDYDAIVLVRADGRSCNGTVIAPRVVLSDGACIGEASAADVSVHIADDAPAADGEGVVASDVLLHPDLVLATPDYAVNFSLLAFASDLATPPVALDREAFSLVAGDPLRLVGWGSSSNTTLDLDKRFVDTEITSGLADGTFDFGDADSSSCRGDAGAALLTRDGGAERLIALNTAGTIDCTGGIGAPLAPHLQDFVDPFVEAHGGYAEVLECGKDDKCVEACAVDPDCPLSDAEPKPIPPEDGEEDADEAQEQLEGERDAGGCRASSDASGAAGALLLAAVVLLLRRRHSRRRRVARRN